MQFTQDEVEKRLSDVVTHGLRKAVAKYTGIFPSIVSAWFNADDERKSPQFTVLHMQAALDNEDPAVGQKHWDEMCAMREASKPRDLAAAQLCVDRELGKLSKEFSDIIVAKGEGRSYLDQKREIAEHRRQLDNYEESVDRMFLTSNPDSVN